MINELKKISIFPLFENEQALFVKQTVLSMFRALLETIMDLRSESVVILKTQSLDSTEGILTRLSYSNAKVFSFDDTSMYNNFSILKEENAVFTEDFLMIIAERFSVVLAWAPTETKGFLNASVSLSSATVNQIYNTIKNNSRFNEVEEYIKKFQLDRRGNVIFNSILNKLLLKVEDYQRDLICANNEIQENSINQEKDTRNVLREYAHELRNSMGMMGVYAKLLQSHSQQIKSQKISPDTVEGIVRASSVIMNAIESAESILSEMSNFSQEIKLNLKEENLKDILTRSVDFVSCSYKQKGVLLELDAKEDAYLNLDKNKVFQVILNLLKNALEATEQGKKVCVILEKNDNKTLVKIKDEGCGITPENQDKIFRQYFSTKSQGSGLGLSVSKEIIEKHNGSLELVSSSNEGSEFVITL